MSTPSTPGNEPGTTGTGAPGSTGTTGSTGAATGTTGTIGTTSGSSGATAGSTGSFSDSGSFSDTGSGGDKKEEAKQQAKEAAGTAADEGKRVAGVAKGEAQNVVAESKQQARNLLDDAMSQVDEQSRTQRDRLVGTLRTFADDVEKMARGEQAEGGMAQDLARQVADRAHDLSSRLDGREPMELLDEVRSFARRRPGAFLFGALAAGMVAGRLTRGAKDARSNDGSGQYGGGYGYASGGQYSSGRSGGVYDDVRGTAAGTPTAGTGYPESTPAYPAGSALDEPGTTADQNLTGTPGTTGAAPSTDPWTGDPDRRGTTS